MPNNCILQDLCTRCWAVGHDLGTDAEVCSNATSPTALQETTEGGGGLRITPCHLIVCSLSHNHVFSQVHCELGK